MPPTCTISFIETRREATIVTGNPRLPSPQVQPASLIVSPQAVFVNGSGTLSVPAATALTVSGQTVGSRVSTVVGKVSITIAPQTVTLRADNKLPVGSKALTVTPQNVILRQESILHVDTAAALAVTPQDVNCVAGALMTVTPQNISLHFDSTLTVDTAASLTVTPQDVSEAWTAHVTGITMVAETGTAGIVQPKPTILFVDSYSVGRSTSIRESSNAITFSDTLGPRGGGCIVTQSTSSFMQYFSVLSGYTDTAVGVCVKVNLNNVTLNAAVTRLIEIRHNAGATERTYVGVNNSNQLVVGRWTNTTTQTVYATTTQTVPAYGYFNLDFRVVLHNTTGQLSLYLDGVPVVDLSAQDTLGTDTSGSPTMVELKSMLVTSTSTGLSNIRFADFMLYNPTGIPHTYDYFGIVNVGAMLPDGAGTYSQSTIAGTKPKSTRWESIGEWGAYDITSIVTFPSATLQDSYQLFEPMDNIDEVHCVAPFAIISANASSTASLFLISGGQTATSASFSLSQSGYSDRTSGSGNTRYIVTLDPSTGNAWARTELVSLEMGVSIPTNSGTVSMARAGVEYAYKPLVAVASNVGTVALATTGTSTPCVISSTIAVSGSEATGATGIVYGTTGITGWDAFTATGTVTAFATGPLPPPIWIESLSLGSTGLSIRDTSQSWTFRTNLGPRGGACLEAGTGNSQRYVAGPITNYYSTSGSDSMGMACAINLNAAGPTGATRIFVVQHNSSSSAMPAIWLNANRTISVGRLTSNAVEATLGTSTVALPVSGWCSLDFHFKLHATTGTMKVYLNRQLVIDVSGVNTFGPSGTSVFSAVFWNPVYVSTGTSGPGKIQFADLILYDAAAGGLTADSNLCGACVDLLMPDGAGTYSESTGVSSANLWENVDEASENADTDYNSFTAGQRDSYTLAAPNTIGSIVGVSPFCVSRVTSNVTRDARLFVVSSATIQETGAFSPNTSYFDKNSDLSLRFVLVLDPATSASWTSSGLTALEVGYRLVTSSVGARLTQIGVEYAYYPPT